MKLSEARIAVVGTGSIGTKHLRVLRSAGIGHLYAISLRKSRRDELEYRGFQTLEGVEYVREEGVDMVIVATDTVRHVDDSIAALEAQCDVLIEKPMATNATEAQAICEVARQNRQRVYVGCLLRFSESLNAFALELKRLGRLHMVKIECQSHLPDWRPDRSYQKSYSAREDEGGVLRDLIHEIDYSGWLFGWPARVQAHLANLGILNIEAEELAVLNWCGPDGAAVNITLDYLSKVPRRGIRVQGERGALEWNAITGQISLARPGEKSEEMELCQTADQRLGAQDIAFIHSCNGGPMDPRLASGEDGAKALAVCDAARSSSKTRKEEMVLYA